MAVYLCAFNFYSFSVPGSYISDGEYQRDGIVRDDGWRGMLSLTPFE